MEGSYSRGFTVYLCKTYISHHHLISVVKPQIVLVEHIYISRMIKIEYPTMMPLARRIQKDTKRLDSDKLIGRMKLCFLVHSLIALAVQQLKQKM